jgi:hypothetical protein
MDTSFARRMHRVLEPVVGQIFFVPEANGPEGEYARLGLKPWPTGYFVSRAWAFGRTPATVIQSTFFNFAPHVATAGIPQAWDVASPEAIGAARDRAVVAALGRLVPDAGDVAATVDLLRRADAAAEIEGRPLYAAIKGVPWPDNPPLLALWHGANRLREYRGDGHIAVLVAAGVDAVEALVLHAGIGEVPKNALLQTRGWSEDEWQAACQRLEERGLTHGEELTEDGRRFRQDIEDRTDQASMTPWLALGEEKAEELRGRMRDIARAIVDNGGVPGRIGRRALEEEGGR